MALSACATASRGGGPQCGRRIGTAVGGYVRDIRAAAAEIRVFPAVWCPPILGALLLIEATGIPGIVEIGTASSRFAHGFKHRVIVQFVARYLH